MSRDYEHQVVNEYNRNTAAHGYAIRDGFSGSGATAFADTWFMYLDDSCNASIYAGELKKRRAKTGNRTTVMQGSAKNSSGVEELRHIVEAAPSFTEPFIGVKFNNKQLAVFSANVLLDMIERDEEEGIFAPRETRGGNVSMVKPEHDIWPSATSGMDDWESIIDYIKRGMGHINEPRDSL